MRWTTVLLLMICVSGCQSPRPGVATAAGGGALSLAVLEREAGKFGAVVRVPEFESTPEAVRAAVSDTIARANAALDAIARRPAREATFANTVVALDDIGFESACLGNRLELVKETSTNAALRAAATEGMKAFQEWAVGLDYREDVYAAVSAYAATRPQLAGEDARLLERTLLDYRRAGLALPKEARVEAEAMRKELARLTTDFSSHVTGARQAVRFTRAELAGVPESVLALPGVKTGEDEFTVMANVTFQYVTVMENARPEGTREKLFRARFNLAREANLPLLGRILGLRGRIAARLGYASWADYQTELKMAKTAGAAREFCEALVRGLQPKFDEELRAFAALKAKETGDPAARIRHWDWRYYSNRLKQEQYAVDAEQLRVFFPYDKVLQGMFAIYERVFGLRFGEVEPPYRWADGVRLYGVTDAGTGEPMGLFYLDMFPREGKYHHFAQFGLIDGKRLVDGRYQRPTVALVCNFPTPQPDRPSLLTHQDVETLFHEFGHALHSLVTRARYVRFSGTSVPRDFVEAPSQMLENWVWDKAVLDGFAADYRDPARKIPPEILRQLKAAKQATIGTFYRRQLAMALLDLRLHTRFREGDDPVRVSNAVFTDVFLPVPEDTAFVAYFNHLMHYDAAYYGYAWADTIAADMATVFERSPRGYGDAEIGRRLREEIYAPGDSRDVNVSIERFLGRPRSMAPFLRNLGIAD
ncbi:MAG: Zn-dependent oligopeptidase [Verrucomicrobia bacterium]|nr:Zn-dependent oligopeptidase [Verrucomicrobiota bacterium]